MARTRARKAVEDRRSRVGADRREKTRQRLIESAMLVFARRGVEGSVIDEVIATAGVARGTFYNYFRSNEDLFLAVAEEVGNQMLLIVDPVVRALPDPAARVATGIRLTLWLARAYPHLAAFMDRVGPRVVGAQSHAAASLARDLADGIATGRFDAMDPRLGFDLVVGPVLAGFHTFLTATVPASYPQDMAQAVLMSLGVPRGQARQLANRPLDEPVIDASSLLARAEGRALLAGLK